MKKFPFFETTIILRPENSDLNVAILEDGRVMIYEFVSRRDFQKIRRAGDDEIIGYLTRCGDIERMYTVFEIFGDSRQGITPGFYPPRDDN